MLTKTIDNGPIAAAEDELTGLIELRRLVQDRHAAALTVIGSDNERAPLSGAALQVLEQALDELVRDRVVVVTGMAKDLSIEEAATLLNATRAGVARLVDQGVIPSQVTNGHPRIRFDDLMAYLRRLEVERAEALQRLADQTQEIAPLLT